MLVSWSHLLNILYPHTTHSVKRKNATNYRRLLFKYGLKRHLIPHSRIHLYDITSLKWEANGVSLEDFIRNRGRYIHISEWEQRYNLVGNPKTRYFALKSKKIPYIRIRRSKRLVFVPADFDIFKKVTERIGKSLDEFNRSLERLALGNVHAIVFPKWKRYPWRLRRVIEFILAQQGRLLRVDRRYAVLVSTLGYTLYDILEREENKIESLLYFIPDRRERIWFTKALNQNKVSIVRPHEVALTPLILISLLG